MSEIGNPGESASPALPAEQAGPSTAVLAKSVRRLRIWLIILTCVVALGVLGFFGTIAVSAIGIASAMSDATGTTGTQVENVRRQIDAAYGSRAQDVVVRGLKMDSGAPFPFSLLGGPEETVYAQYRLKGSPVMFADIVGGIGGDDPAASGFLPTQGTLTSKMSSDQLDRLLAAYAAQTHEPLGSVKRYGDNSSLAVGDSATPPPTVTVDGKTYKTSELWAATQGRVVTGSTIKLDDSLDFSSKALIFYEDPKTGQFVFLGTEPTQNNQ